MTEKVAILLRPATSAVEPAGEEKRREVVDIIVRSKTLHSVYHADRDRRAVQEKAKMQERRDDLLMLDRDSDLLEC